MTLGALTRISARRKLAVVLLAVVVVLAVVLPLTLGSGGGQVTARSLLATVDAIQGVSKQACPITSESPQGGALSAAMSCNVDAATLPSGMTAMQWEQAVNGANGGGCGFVYVAGQGWAIDGEVSSSLGQQIVQKLGGSVQDFPWCGAGSGSTSAATSGTSPSQGATSSARLRKDVVLATYGGTGPFLQFPYSRFAAALGNTGNPFSDFVLVPGAVATVQSDDLYSGRPTSGHEWLDVAVTDGDEMCTSGIDTPSEGQCERATTLYDRLDAVADVNGVTYVLKSPPGSAQGLQVLSSCGGSQSFNASYGIDVASETMFCQMQTAANAMSGNAQTGPGSIELVQAEIPTAAVKSVVVRMTGNVGPQDPPWTAALTLTLDGKYRPQALPQND